MKAGEMLVNELLMWWNEPSSQKAETWTGTPNAPASWGPDITTAGRIEDWQPMSEHVEEVVRSALAPDRPDCPIWGIWMEAWHSISNSTNASTNPPFVGMWWRGNGVVFHTRKQCVALAQLHALRGDATYAGLTVEYRVRRIDKWAAGIHDRAGDVWQES